MPAMKSKINSALDHIRKARLAIDDYLMSPITMKTPRDTKEEMLRRIQAVEFLDDAERWVIRLDKSKAFAGDVKAAEGQTKSSCPQSIHSHKIRGARRTAVA